MNNSKKAKLSLALSNLSSSLAVPTASAQAQGKKSRQKSKTVALPAAMSRINRTSAARVNNLAEGRIRIRHREYIGEIKGSASFATEAFPINPGMAKTFPYLSQMAYLFESYLFRGLSFSFETEKGSATVGSLMMAVDYDAADPAPLTKVSLMANRNAVRSPVWGSVSYNASSDDLHKFGVQRYVRQFIPAPNLDIKTYDVGNLFVSTQGCVDASVIGELYVAYDVELITPHLETTSAPSTYSCAVVSGMGITPTEPFGSAPVLTGPADLLQLVDSSSFKILRTGDYCIEVDASGTGINSPTPNLTTTAPTHALPGLRDGTVNSLGRAGISVTSVPTLVKMAMNATSIVGLATRLLPYSYGLP